MIFSRRYTENANQERRRARRERMDAERRPPASSSTLRDRSPSPPPPPPPPGEGSLEEELYEMNRPPRAPKQDPLPQVLTDISKHPILQMFLGHLVSFEGKNRKKSDAKEHMRRVCRLLYEVDSEGRDVKLVWADASLDTICNICSYSIAIYVHTSSKLIDSLI